MNTQYCKINYKGIERLGTIVDSKMDKLKVNVLDGSIHDTKIPHKLLRTDWFDRKEVKRLWI
jgi:hypothetical protein